ncbi:hypothetical protein T4B_12957 [Trichinella pseudospiralis]|uniref:Uncharacterized protein n=1 Tax=Trichinella pseudospiralis TaxID=6337 RepID=A0A0V1GAA2_TRIPS|nr:hypothetical protein T4B_12957 [Trichinella pseudospiralis]
MANGWARRLRRDLWICTGQLTCENQGKWAHRPLLQLCLG